MITFEEYSKLHEIYNNSENIQIPDKEFECLLRNINIPPTNKLPMTITGAFPAYDLELIPIFREVFIKIKEFKNFIPLQKYIEKLGYKCIWASLRYNTTLSLTLEIQITIHIDKPDNKGDKYKKQEFLNS